MQINKFPDRHVHKNSELYTHFHLALDPIKKTTSYQFTTHLVPTAALIICYFVFVCWSWKGKPKCYLILQKEDNLPRLCRGLKWLPLMLRTTKVMGLPVKKLRLKACEQSQPAQLRKHLTWLFALSSSWEEMCKVKRCQSSAMLQVWVHSKSNSNNAASPHGNWLHPAFSCVM